MINYSILTLMLKQLMVRRQFRLDLQHCKQNLLVYVTVRLRLLLDRVRDDDYFDVWHLAPDECYRIHINTQRQPIQIQPMKLAAEHTRKRNNRLMVGRRT